MPFGLRFKRTRRYDISTKNVYMVVVQVLDGSYLECTLNTDSTGHECLDAIAQKIELEELQYFGLRYVTKKIQFRWVDLGKPLKKQLDKYAQTSHTPRSPKLFFGVMYYIANAHKIVDDVARYQYYLQLKSDIVDGRLPLTLDQVIKLAAYSLQVEFNDFESDRPVDDYFTDNNVFPKNMTHDTNILQELMNEILQVYMGLQGMHPVKAEIEYMKEIQMMDGYGMEYYITKDERGKELYLGTSYTGIFARYPDKQPPIFFKWTEITRFQQSKKSFEVDTSKNSMQFQMEDSDTAKYLKRMCLLQQKFYKCTKLKLSSSLRELEDFAETDHLPDMVPQGPLANNEMSADRLHESHTSLQSLKYGEQKYEQDSRSASVTTDDYYTRSQQSLNVSAGDLSSPVTPEEYQGRRASSASTYMQQLQHQQQQQQLQQHAQQHQAYTQPAPQIVTDTSSQQSQDVDPTSDPNYASRLAALPAYRQAPSYSDVMKQKMNQAQITQAPQHLPGSQHLQHDFNQNLADSRIYGTQSEEGLAYSQPEIRTHTHPMGFNTDGHYHISADVGNYPPQHMSMYPDLFADQSQFMQYRIHDRQSNLVMQPTYSSPELNTQGLPQEYTGNAMFNINENYMLHYKPPPPYPRASNSTPDLAAQTGSRIASNSPDLVSRRNLGGSALSSHSNLELSVENITDTIPEVVHISENTVETETGIAEVQPVGGELDDASSDHSNSTFHIKETDSETEDSFVRSLPQRQSSKSKVTVRFVAPNKAPPPSTSKEVAAKRESFRRMMIARSGSFTPGVLRENDNTRFLPMNRSLRAKDKNGIEETILETSRSSNKSPVIDKLSPSTDPVKENLKNVLSKVAQNTVTSTESIPPGTPTSGREVVRSQSDANKATNNKVTVIHEKAVSVDSSTERQQLLDKLKYSEPEVSTISENERLTSSQERLVDYDDTDSDSDTPQSPIGPLKLAAMNGLTMSRPMVLALMNDETRAPKDERRKILERKLSENLVFKEFEETPKKILEFDCNVAKLPENTLRNRFRDVLPYDSTRVKLNPRKDNSSGYINASHIKLTVGQRLWWYIATQAPLDNTPADFWQMVWEQEVEVVAMLTALMELGRPKCYPYFPQEAGPEHRIVFGDYEVQLMFANDSLCYITNLISLKHVPSKKERKVWHLHYTGWPDHGCPDDIYGFLGFLDEIESVQRLAESEEGSGKKSPVVVHCSAGVGRTGVVILTQVMKWCLDNNKEIDLPKALAKIRQQRMYMVQTLGQYDFVHKTLIQYLKNTRLI